jgi:hypothetical protein
MRRAVTFRYHRVWERARHRRAHAYPSRAPPDQRSTRALRLIRRVYPVRPTRLRYVAPYHEALGRLCGRSRPDLMTRSLNRLWMGRERMDD